MGEETEANPAEDSELLSDEGADEQATETTDESDADEGSSEESQAEDDDSEEVEHDGQKYKVPKALKAAIMMDADYRRKTMDLAEERKAVIAEKASFAQANTEVIQAQAKLLSADEQLAQYEQIDWDAWAQSDPTSAQVAAVRYQQLERTRAKLADEAKTKQEALTSEAQRARAKQLEEGAAILQRDIPGWGPELDAKLSSFAVKEFGYTPAELSAVSDPRVVKLLYAALQAKDAQAKNKTVQKIVQAQAVKPAATVGQAAPATKDPNRMSTDEWMRHREAQLRKKRA